MAPSASIGADNAALKDETRPGDAGQRRPHFDQAHQSKSQRRSTCSIIARPRGARCSAPGALERGQQRVMRLLDEIKLSRRKADKGAKSDKLRLWNERKKLIRNRVTQTLKSMPMRAPEQVLEDLAKRINRLEDDKNATELAAFVVRAKGCDEAGVLRRLASVSGASSSHGWSSGTPPKGR